MIVGAARIVQLRLAARKNLESRPADLLDELRALGDQRRHGLRRRCGGAPPSRARKSMPAAMMASLK